MWKVLHDAHYQFDAILIDDGTWDTAALTAESLKRYEVLFLPLRQPDSGM